MNYKSILLKQNKKIFSTDDLALLWEIVNRNTLITTIKRYVSDNTLYSIRKGLYSVMPINKIDPYLLGVEYISGFCYVSLQTILSRFGLINQKIESITLVGGRSTSFSVGNHDYICKKMAPQYLHNLEGIEVDGLYPKATVERAIADTQYFNPDFYFDAPIVQYQEKVKLIKKKVFL